MGVGSRSGDAHVEIERHDHTDHLIPEKMFQFDIKRIIGAESMAGISRVLCDNTGL